MRRRAPSLICFALVGLACDEPAGPALPALSIVTDSLPRALTGVAYDQSLEATGGEPPYTWELSPASGGLPPGLTLSSDGRITGTPLVPALAPVAVAVHVESADRQSAQRTFSMLVPPLLRPDESCSHTVPQAVASFEDPELEALARAWLDVTDGQDLTCAMLRTLTSVANGILEPEISSLVGMQNLTQLTTLGFVGVAGIADLSPLRGLTSLTDLTIIGASIADVTPLAALTNLTRLSLTHNSIGDVAPLGGLTGLVELRLSHNVISDVGPLAGLTNLEVLWIGRGAVGHFDTSGVPAVRGDPITDLTPIAGLTKLTQLWIHGQEVETLDALAGLSDLESLNAYDSGITDLSGLSSLTSLRSLSLGGNEISDLSPLAGLAELRGLVLRDNAITDAGPLAGLSSLESLDLSHNSIADLDPLAGLSSVGILHLSHNGIADVAALEELTALHELMLDGNAALADVQPLLDNPGLGRRLDIPPPNQDYVDLRGTAVPCEQIAALEAKGAIVISDCP